MTRSCSLCGSNGHNSRTCDQSTVAGRSGGASGGGGEFMLFGVRVKVDPLRKTVSMNDLSNYETPNNNNALPVITNDSSTTEKAVEDTDIGGGGGGGGGYVSADEALQHQHSGGRERKRGTPWTEEEHRLFLFGLQKVGKGDWKGISRNFVKSRTPTQVASHAQKYFIRKNNLNRRRRRSSLFDITTDSVTESMDEGKFVNENAVPSSVVATAFLPAAQPQYSPNTTTTTTTTTTVNSGCQASHQLPSPTSILYYSLPYPARAPFPESTTKHPDELNVGYYESASVAATAAPLSLRLSLGQSSSSSMRYSDNNNNNIISVV